MSRVVAATFLLLSIIGWQVPAHSGVIGLDAELSGSLRSSLTQAGIVTIREYTYRDPLELLSASATPSPRGGTGIFSLGYLVYDLSSVVGSVDRALLQLDIQYSQPSDPEVEITALSAALSSQLLGIPAAGASYSESLFTFPTPPEYFLAVEHFSAISAGERYGVLGEIGPIDGVFNIELNGAALDAINTNGGLIGLGISWSSAFPSGTIGTDSIRISAKELILEGDTGAVPAPATLWLFLVALSVLALRPSSCYCEPP